MLTRTERRICKRLFKLIEPLRRFVDGSIRIEERSIVNRFNVADLFRSDFDGISFQNAGEFPDMLFEETQESLSFRLRLVGQKNGQLGLGNSRSPFNSPAHCVPSLIRGSL